MSRTDLQHENSVPLRIAYLRICVEWVWLNNEGKGCSDRQEFATAKAGTLSDLPTAVLELLRGEADHELARRTDLTRIATDPLFQKR